ncbi:hypothetical protein BH11PLA1_BH11PLA1_08920 [soil metagenome]
MADPLGLVGGNGSTIRLTPTGAGSVGVGGGESAPGGVNFQDTLAKSLDQLNAAEQDAAGATQDLLAGDRTDVENVMLATAKADQAFRLALSVRNKVQAAFDELKQVRI